MSYTLIFNVEAENEYLTAFIWYEEQQKGLGERFENETEEQLGKIKANPLLYHFSKGNYRESFLTNFPFTIVYVVNKKAKTIYISSVFHTSRNPKEKYRK